MRNARPLVIGLALLLGLVGLASAPTAAAQVPTSISIRAERGAVAPGGAVVIAGHLFAPDVSTAGRPISLEAQAAGEVGFTPVDVAVTGASGGVRLVVRPESSTRFRLRYDGADDAGPGVSGVVLVRVRVPSRSVRRAPTSISVRAHKPAVLPGVATTISGQLRGPQAGLGRLKVVLLAKSAGADTWQFHDARRTDRAGQVNFLIRPRTHTEYRLTFAGATGLRPARSGIVDVQLRPVVTIAAEPGQLDPGQSTTVSGTVTSETGPVAGATVDLLAREVGRGAVWTVVASTTTAADGSASVLAAPTATTSYRLRANAFGDVPAGRSVAVRVEVRSPSTLSIRGTRTTEGFVVIGRLLAEQHAVRGGQVALQSYDAATSTWRTVTSGLTGGEGRVRFVQPATAGTSYRLTYDGPRFASSASATLTT